MFKRALSFVFCSDSPWRTFQDSPPPFPLQTGMHSLSQHKFPEYLPCARLCLGRGWEYRGDDQDRRGPWILLHLSIQLFTTTLECTWNANTHKKNHVSFLSTHQRIPSVCVCVCVRERERERERERSAREKTLSFAVVSRNKGSIFVSPCSKIPCPSLNAHTYVTLTVYIHNVYSWRAAKSASHIIQSGLAAGTEGDRNKLLIKGYKSTATGVLWCLQAEGSSKVLHKCNNIYNPRASAFYMKIKSGSSV